MPKSDPTSVRVGLRLADIDDRLCLLEERVTAIRVLQADIRVLEEAVDCLHSECVFFTGQLEDERAQSARLRARIDEFEPTPSWKTRFFK